VTVVAHNLTIPACEYRRTALTTPRKLPAGLDIAVDSMVGAWKRRPTVLMALRSDARKVDALAGEFDHIGDGKLREALAGFRENFCRAPERSRDLLFPALAAIREAAARQTGMRPYLVQIMGALALHRGYLAEMATGEGKTLVAGVGTVLAGWTRRPCHIITVNDYLAERDAEWLRPLYRFCGLTVGHVTGPMEPADRKHGYDQDVTYTTGKEILADFLRDRLRLGPMQHPARRFIRGCIPGARTAASADGIVMRGLHTAVVDEVDSILIDEAVTPLIISHPAPNDSLKDACRAAYAVAHDLEPGTDYRIGHQYKEVELTPHGERRVRELGSARSGVWRSRDRWTELVEQALNAKEFFHSGQQYVVQDDHVTIVDEYTGRLMPQRTWRHGLHQAIEAKEGLDVSDPSETLSRLSFQRFFRFFNRLSGMTGTAREATGEMWRIYRMPVVRIPTNEPCIRGVRPDCVFASEGRKWDAITDAILDCHRRQQPVLVGTRSVAASEELAARLQEHDVELNLLNAVHHREEARVVAEAGSSGRITIATNMAGRGTDIVLADGVAELGGLHVIATERHDSRRIDRQLFGRSARQGDPGSAQAFISLDDELFVRFLPGKSLRRWLGALVAGHIPGSSLLVRLALRYAQAAARRQAYKQRKSVLRMDTWLDDSLSFTASTDRIS